MDSNYFPEIKTKRLILRQIKLADWKMVSYLRSDNLINQYVKRPSAETKEKAIEFINKTNKDINNKSLFYWCISEVGKTKMIGSICLWNFSEDKKIAEVGYDLCIQHHGKGIMNEALGNILDFGFKNLHLEKIEAYTQWNNSSSLKLLDRNGFYQVKHKTDKENKDNLIYEVKSPLL